MQSAPCNEAVNDLETAKEKLEQIRRHKIEGIFTRSRVKWHEKGERSTSYFLNLEKRIFSNRLIASLEDDSGKIITDQNEIIGRLVEYYRAMFKERPNKELETEDILKDIDVKQISDNEKTDLESVISLEEYESALKRMPKNKSPGSDGFSVEFFQHFWNDLKIFFVQMVNESIEAGTLPMTLREGILTLLPKPNRPRSEIKSYRPITLLNVSYKIIASAIANRIKQVLPTVIDRDQTGFMKDRFIGDNTRLTYDLIQELKKEDRRALFLSLDIEDAFNAVDWKFTKSVMRKRNFPENILRLFDMLYVGSYSRIVYNGHISDKIMLERSCRQGDPLSPYIFLIVIECALEMIRCNNHIKGVKIGVTEYKISAYADDILCFLDGDVNSCRALFDDLGVFAKYSGLKPNIHKTQAFWAGSNKDQNEDMLMDFNFTWTKKLKVLGIVFANEENLANEENYNSKLRVIQSVIKDWKRRYITARGKITLIKTLLLSKLTHILISLPRPSEDFMKRLKSALFGFIWGSKVDKLQRLSICKPYIKGGLEMVDIDTHIEGLKATWVRREIKSEHSWTQLFKESVSGGRCLWEMNGRSLLQFAKQTRNPFWAEVLRAFSKISDGIKIDDDDLNRCGLWFSNVTKHTTSCNKQWRIKGLYYLNDIVDNRGRIMSFEQVKQIYKIGLKETQA